MIKYTMHNAEEVWKLKRKYHQMRLVLVLALVVALTCWALTYIHMKHELDNKQFEVDEALEMLNLRDFELGLFQGDHYGAYIHD